MINRPAEKPHAERRFVCVHNRARDNYEVALALQEAGLLDTLVTDFYRPDRLPLPGAPGRRYRRGLPSRATTSAWLSFLIQYAGEALRRPMAGVFPASDRALARKALRVARRNESGLYGYSSYLGGGSLGDVKPVIVFEYHPHPALALAILENDHARFPQVAWSFRRETAVNAAEPLTTAWQEADAVVCASAMTRRSLVHAGCPEERITVVPYGADPPGAPPRVRAPGPCRFLFVGQGIQRKGLHHLAEAWRRIGPGDASLTVVSYLIDPGIAAMLDQPGITVLKRQDRAQLARLFEASDVFVMPSLVEGFGLVYLEALAAGCHVIGTANTGLPDLPLSSVSASLIEAGDIDALAASLHQAITCKAADGFDPAAIAAEGTAWTWSDFRKRIAEHAGAVMAAEHRNRG